MTQPLPLHAGILAAPASLCLHCSLPSTSGCHCGGAWSDRRRRGSDAVPAYGLLDAPFSVMLGLTSRAMA